MPCELDPAPEGVSLPGLELPPLPASPPEPGRAVPLVLAPLVPLGLEDCPELDELLPEDVDGALVSVALVAAISGVDSTQVKPAMANAEIIVFFIRKSLLVEMNKGCKCWRLCQSLYGCDSPVQGKSLKICRMGDERLSQAADAF
ncbi:hypothetical protein ACCD10_00480 [Pseudomonas sp. Pseusp122]|uniref:hypothetical protein n=1 Tax=unclassified Pseudomonas TaxID=196821 RepID=UPI0039A757B3